MQGHIPPAFFAQPGSDMMISHREGVKTSRGWREPRRDQCAAGIANVSFTPRPSFAATSWSAAVVFKRQAPRCLASIWNEHLKVSDLSHPVCRCELAPFASRLPAHWSARCWPNGLQLEVGNSFTDRCPRPAAAVPGECHLRDGDCGSRQARVFVHMNEARSLLKSRSGVTFIQVNLFDKDRAVKDAEQMQEVLHHTAAPCRGAREGVAVRPFAP